MAEAYRSIVIELPFLYWILLMIVLLFSLTLLWHHLNTIYACKALYDLPLHGAQGAVLAEHGTSRRPRASEIQHTRATMDRCTDRRRSRRRRHAAEKRRVHDCDEVALSLSHLVVKGHTRNTKISRFTYDAIRNHCVRSRGH